MSDDLLILMIEDNEADVRTIQRLLKNTNNSWSLMVRETGREALDELRRLDQDEVPSPDLVLLDLNLPYVHGLEVLQQYKNHRIMSSVPIIILTTSRNDTDRQQARELGVDRYIHKPDDVSDLKEELIPILRGL